MTSINDYVTTIEEAKKKPEQTFLVQLSYTNNAATSDGVFTDYDIADKVGKTHSEVTKAEIAQQSNSSPEESFEGARIKGKYVEATVQAIKELLLEKRGVAEENITARVIDYDAHRSAVKENQKRAQKGGGFEGGVNGFQGQQR